MTTRTLPIETDGATARFACFARGVLATGLLPKTSADLLVRRARGLRLMCEAREVGLAGAVLDDIERLAKEGKDEAPLVCERIEHHVGAVRKALR